MPMNARKGGGRMTSGADSPERLAWDEIISRYPDQWVGLSGIRYLDDDGVTIESAIVSGTGTKNDMFRRQIDGDADYVLCTKAENPFENWSNWL